MKKFLITLTTLILCATMCAAPALAGNSQTEYQSTFLSGYGYTSEQLYDDDMFFTSTLILDMMMGLNEPVLTEAVNLISVACLADEVYVMRNHGDREILSACFSDGINIVLVQYFGDTVSVIIAYGAGSASGMVKWCKSEGYADKYKKVDSELLLQMILPLIGAYKN